MGPFKGELPVFARLSPVRPPWRATRKSTRRRLSRRPGNIRIRVRVNFTTGHYGGHPSNSWASCPKLF